MDEDMKDALALLGVPERASLREVRRLFREKIFLWHPDRCASAPEECREKSQEIIAAYNRVVAYCEKQQIDFSHKGTDDEMWDDPAEFWKQRFGSDPLSGG